jgi:hypothetical protein
LHSRKSISTSRPDWYEKEQAGLGREFLDELRATYDRIVDGPLK